MSAMIPMAVYGLEVPCGDMPVPANVDGIPAAFRITMAAIDPTAEPEEDEGDVPRATLKIIRQSLDADDEDDEDDDEDEDFDVSKYDRMFLGEGDDDDEDEEESEDEDLKGGPSDPAKSKKARKAAAQKEIALLLEGGDMDVDDAPNGVNGTKKSAKALGKMPASDDSEDDEDDEDDDSEGGEIEEFVICTLDPTKNYQQALDITVGERERVFFMVSGTHSIYLTGNYVEPAENLQGSEMYDPDSDEEDDYDLEPDSDELDEDDEEDELDDLENPRITELEEEDEDEAPELIKAAEKKQEKKKGKNKRPAEDEEVADADTIDSLIANEAAKAKVNGETKLSKKQAKKLKKNDGSAAAVEEAKKEVEAPSSTKADKKVQFAKELEQGPTPTKDAKDDKSKAALGVKVVQGVTLDDKKLGKGPAAKNGDRVGMRYIGKLQKDNSVFDSNKKGKPFTFKLGAGEVIKGWDIGIHGMCAGGERRITIPPHHGYGNKGVPGIPGNSTLVFDVKVVEIHRK